MSFPPGLIPQLVREKNVTNPPYSPLSPLDIEALGLPPSTPPDAYLASRLEKFYAELQVCKQRASLQRSMSTGFCPSWIDTIKAITLYTTGSE